MKGNGKMIKDMAKGFICLKMVIVIVENGWWTKGKDKEILFGLMEIFIQAIGKVIKEMDKELKFG